MTVLCSGKIIIIASHSRSNPKHHLCFSDSNVGMAWKFAFRTSGVDQMKSRLVAKKVNKKHITLLNLVGAFQLVSLKNDWVENNLGIIHKRLLL